MADPTNSRDIDLQVQRETAGLLAAAAPLLARLADLSTNPANRNAMACGVVDWTHSTTDLRPDVARVLVEGIDASVAELEAGHHTCLWFCLNPAPSWLGGLLVGALGWQAFRSNRESPHPSLN